MMLISLLYLSTSKLDPASAECEVTALVAACQIRNKARGLTGALIFTGTHFAQVVEGEDEAVDTLMKTVSNDARHADMIVVDRRPLAVRRFADWSMAYSGPSRFVARHVDRLLNDPSPAELRRATERLIELLRRFAAKSPSA